MSRQNDIVIVGSGVAGILSATYLSLNTDFRIEVVAPVFGVEAWHCTYCCWQSEIEKSWLAKLVHGYCQFSWDAKVALKSGVKDLDRYCQLDNKSILKTCFSILRKSDKVTLTKGWAELLNETSVLLKGGQRIHGSYVLDCTGPFSKFLSQPTYTIFPVRYQIFYGEVLEWKNHGQDFNLMDYSIHFKDSYPDSFAYVLPLSEHRIFVEETILVCDTKCPFDILQERFLKRLAKLGMKDLNSRICTFHEQYAIPMGGHLPSKSGPIRLGSCGRMTHPATGYCFSYTVRQIPKLAKALTERKSNKEIWDAIHADWLCYYWYCFGQEILAQLSTNTQCFGFFSAVFGAKEWFEFMTRNLSEYRTLMNALDCALHFDFWTMMHFLKALFYATWILFVRVCNSLFCACHGD